MYYQHDMCHCNGENCKLKDTCYRFIIHLDGVKRGLTYLTYFVNPPVKDDKCNSYIEAKYYGD